MECDICLEAFDHEQRVPKVAACGHTCCLECLKRSQRRECPQCRAEIRVAPDALPHNFTVLRMMRDQADDRALDPPPAAARPPAAALDTHAAEAPPLREMDVISFALTAPGARQEEKAAALQQAQGVVRLAGLSCDRDPAWSLQLLQRAAPTVERLGVSNLREEHLRAVHAMPRLRRLRMSCNDRALDVHPPELSALPPGHSGLRWLSMQDLPRRATLQSLLRAHAGTLEELELQVGTQGIWMGSALPSLLKQCGLRALRRLVLRRTICSYTACREQRAAVREALALPGLQVLCDACDNVQHVQPETV